MRLAAVQWIAAASVAVLVHGTLLVAWQSQSDGEARPPAGTSVEIAASMDSIMGAAVAHVGEAEAPKEISSLNVMVDVPESATVLRDVGSRDVAVLALVEPPQDEPAAKTDLPRVEAREPVREAVLRPPPKPTVAKRRPESREAEKKTQPMSGAASKKKGAGKKRAGRQGTAKKGSTGNRPRGGGQGKRRASSGAVASFKSKVRARIASCVRARVSGRGGGRVVIRFGVSSGGRARGVSTSGSASLRSVAAAAARGCSFPRPPTGAGGLRFSFPVSVR